MGWKFDAPRFKKGMYLRIKNEHAEEIIKSMKKQCVPVNKIEDVVAVRYIDCATSGQLITYVVLEHNWMGRNWNWAANAEWLD